ncbi:MAG TPA: hypothetical protein VFI25_08130 [Planctomycetota bacterium]|nr:hypothetical protein [Planctomycetota bacterium]
MLEAFGRDYPRRTGRSAQVRVVRPSGAAGVYRDSAASNGG